MPRAVFAVALLMLLAGCRLPGSAESCSTVQIDWVDFIQVGSTQYVAGPETESVLQESDLGPVYSKVKFKVSGNVCDPQYHPKDGDAAFLDAGTPIYQVTGHPPGEQLAALSNGRIVVYRPVVRS